VSTVPIFEPLRLAIAAGQPERQAIGPPRTRRPEPVGPDPGPLANPSANRARWPNPRASRSPPANPNPGHRPDPDPLANQVGQPAAR